MASDPERKSRVITVLNDAGMNAFICDSASEVLLLSGYWPVMGASVAIFTVEGGIYVILPEDEVELAQESSQAELIPYKPAGLDTLDSPIQTLAKPLGQLLSRLGLCRATIGMQMQLGRQPSSYAASVQFRTSLLDLMGNLQPGNEYVACDDVLEQMKARKTPKELQRIRHSVDSASAGFAVAAESIYPGQREVDVAASIQAAFEKSSASASSLRTYGFFYCMSGPNAARASAAYARTRQRRIEEGDLVMIHANTCADGYWSDLTRTYTAGVPSTRQQEIRAAIESARAAALHAIRPGVPARDVDRAARTVMESHGFGAAFRHSTGHAVGFAAANPNGLPRIHPLSPDVLEDQMTFNIEPAAYFDGYGGMRHCDVVAVTPEGASVVSQF